MEQENITQRPGAKLAARSREQTLTGARAPSLRPATAALTTSGDSLELRVFWPRESGEEPGNPGSYQLAADRWERLQIPLPSDWQGGGMRLHPRCRFGLLEIVGVRVISPVSSKPLWEMLGKDLVRVAAVSAGTQVLANSTRLRLLLTADEVRLTLPDIPLYGSEFPLTLELGIRVRLDLSAIGYAVQEWVSEANSRLAEATESRDAAETARAYEADRASRMLAEVELARLDGQSREEAAREQVRTAHADARLLADRLHEEIATVRGQLDSAHTDARALAERLHEEIATVRGQLDSAHTDARALAERLHEEIATVRGQLDSAHAAARTHAATLLAEIDALRADADRRETAARDQLTVAEQNSARLVRDLELQIERARAHGEERATVLTAEIDSLRLDADRRVEALQTQLASAHTAAREQAATLYSEIEAARAHGEQISVTLTSELERLRAQIGMLSAQLQEAHVQRGEVEAAHRAQMEAIGESERLRARLDEASQQLLDSGSRLQEATAQKDALRSELERAQADRRELLDENARKQRERDALAGVQLETAALLDAERGRVRSMQRSFSWRLTLPLRIVARLLTGRRAAEKPRGT